MNEKNTAKETLCAPGSGVISERNTGALNCVIDLENPDNGDIVAPVGGIVTEVGGEYGMVSIRSAGGLSVQVSIGIPGPRRRGTAEGCHIYVSPGDAVQPGQRLMHAELSRIRRFGGGTECVMTVAGTEEDRHPVKREGGSTVRAGQTPVMQFSLLK